MQDKNPSHFLSKTEGVSLTLTPAASIVHRILCLPRLDLAKQLFDFCLIFTAAFWAWVVSFGQVPNPGSPWPFVSTVVGVRILIYYALQLHQSSWLHVSRFEISRLALSAMAGVPLIPALWWILPAPFSVGALHRPLLLITTEPVFYLLLLFAARITARAMNSSRKRGELQRILVVGAGNAGHALAFQIQECGYAYRIVGFLDDDPRKHNRRYRGVPVLGSIADLQGIVREHDVQEVVVAISNFPPQRLRAVLADSEECEVPVRILPPLRELLGGKADIRALREVRMEDLLPRAEVKVAQTSFTNYLAGKTVLVTGGGGSIGGELCRQAVAANVKKLLILGRGENSVFEMSQELGELGANCALVPIICDVRDQKALRAIFEKHKPDLVFHAAAHKHVPLMEQYPCESVKNNVFGTLNVVELAVEYRVERFVMVSTDKAVDPSSVMGATKRLGEMIVKGYAAQTGMSLVSVRFGNVLGSRGSVVPTMKRQIRQGKPITVTDPEMVRYFMTIPEAVQLILKAGSMQGSGEVFILDMGRPVRILDLAHDLIRLSGLVPNQDIEIKIVGKRPGEKLREELLTNHEETQAEKRGPFFVAPPEVVQLNSLLEQLNQLRATSYGEDVEATLGLLRHLVPNFHSERFIGKDTTPNSSEQEIRDTGALPESALPETLKGADSSLVSERSAVPILR